MSSADTPRPKKIHEECRQQREIGWVQSARSLTIALVLLALGSLGGGAAWLASVSAEAAELRSDVRHLAERQQEIRSQLSQQMATDQRIERESSSTSAQVLVQLGSLRTEVQEIGRRLGTLEDTRPRSR